MEGRAGSRLVLEALTGLARKVGDAKSRRQRFGGNPRENEGR